MVKHSFEKDLKQFVKTLNHYVSTKDGQWAIKGFIDVLKNVYTISADTKIISKILEIHLFPKILKFATDNGYELVLAEHQNYYPDMTFMNKKDKKIKFAVDLKTTYRSKNGEYCNGFTLGSHGKYFVNRDSRKNIQFPYKDYLGHFCLGIIYTRAKNSKVDETKTYKIDELDSITSVIKDMQFFVAEKWKIASDKGGSGNTANIGSIKRISDITSGEGIFSRLGEKWFDDYWMNYGKIKIQKKNGKFGTIKDLHDFVLYRNGDVNLIVNKAGRSRTKKK